MELLKMLNMNLGINISKKNNIDLSHFKAFVSITFESIDVLSENDMSIINNKLLINDKIKFSIINSEFNGTYIIGLSL